MSIICFCVLDKVVMGIVALVLSIIICMFLIHFCYSIYNKFIKQIKHVTSSNLYFANEYLFLKRKLYMMVSNDFKFFSLYVLPKEVNIGLLIMHNSFYNNTNYETTFTNTDYIKVNKTDLTKDYSNFKTNYITNLNNFTYSKNCEKL